MNKKLCFSVILACLLILKTNVTLFAQTSSNEQRLVGTWTALHDPTQTITFNSNGTMSIVGGDPTSNPTFNGFTPTHWAAAGDRLLVFIPVPNSRRAIRYFHISSDGRTLITSTIAVEGEDSTGSIGTAWRRN